MPFLRPGVVTQHKILNAYLLTLRIPSIKVPVGEGKVRNPASKTI